jgi:hypothetical protein
VENTKRYYAKLQHKSSLIHAACKKKTPISIVSLLGELNSKRTDKVPNENGLTQDSLDPQAGQQIRTIVICHK